MTGAEVFVSLVGWWLTAGAVVAAAFLLFGVDAVDEDAQGAYAFRPLLILGVLLIWPLVIWRWVTLVRGSEDWAKRYRPIRDMHLPVSVVLAIAIAFAVISGLAVRQTWPADIAPERLSEDQS